MAMERYFAGRRVESHASVIQLQEENTAVLWKRKVLIRTTPKTSVRLVT
jgi:hypothetical protein